MTFWTLFHSLDKNVLLTEKKKCLQFLFYRAIQDNILKRSFYIYKATKILELKQVKDHIITTRENQKQLSGMTTEHLLLHIFTSWETLKDERKG